MPGVDGGSAPDAYKQTKKNTENRPRQTNNKGGGWACGLGQGCGCRGQSKTAPMKAPCTRIPEPKTQGFLGT